jgi:nicotinate-nucleotide pyrophosphorylase (carboxylating)
MDLNDLTSLFQKEVDHLVGVAIAEDLRSGDITSEACIPSDAGISGKFVLKQGAVVCGLTLLPLIFKKTDPKIEITSFIEEGSFNKAGTIIAGIKGPAIGIFAAERVALNILQHTCGISTVTRQYVKEVAGFDCDILDTRKTLPGLRCLEKYAVRVGGGRNHRYALDDRFIIKHNHLSFLSKETKYPVREAVTRAREYRPSIVVEVEVENLHMVKEAIEAHSDIIMLDNMSPPMVREAVRMINGRAYVEAAGGIILETVRAYAATGVNGVSIGALTHSVPAIDISLRLAKSSTHN